MKDRDPVLKFIIATVDKTSKLYSHDAHLGISINVNRSREGYLAWINRKSHKTSYFLQTSIQRYCRDSRISCFSNLSFPIFLSLVSLFPVVFFIKPIISFMISFYVLSTDSDAISYTSMIDIVYCLNCFININSLFLYHV